MARSLDDYLRDPDLWGEEAPDGLDLDNRLGFSQPSIGNDDSAGLPLYEPGITPYDPRNEDLSIRANANAPNPNASYRVSYDYDPSVLENIGQGVKHGLGALFQGLEAAGAGFRGQTPQYLQQNQSNQMMAMQMARLGATQQGRDIQQQRLDQQKDQQDQRIVWEYKKQYDGNTAKLKEGERYFKAQGNKHAGILTSGLTYDEWKTYGGFMKEKYPDIYKQFDDDSDFSHTPEGQDLLKFIQGEYKTDRIRQSDVTTKDRILAKPEGEWTSQDIAAFDAADNRLNKENEIRQAARERMLAAKQQREFSAREQPLKEQKLASEAIWSGVTDPKIKQILQTHNLTPTTQNMQMAEEYLKQQAQAEEVFKSKVRAGSPTDKLISIEQTGQLPGLLQPGQELQGVLDTSKARSIEIAGERKAATAEALRDIKVGLDAPKYRKLLPDGGTEIAKPDQTPNELEKQGFVDASHYTKQLDETNDIKITEERVKKLHKYAQEVITADPGILNTATQAARLAYYAGTKGGPPTKIMSEDGSRNLTVGEVVNIYNRERTAMMEAVSRSVNMMRGAGTEGDVMRGIAATANTWDTKEGMNAVFGDLLKAFERTRRYGLGTVFGNDQVEKVMGNMSNSPKDQTSADGLRLQGRMEQLKKQGLSKEQVYKQMQLEGY